MSDLIRVLMQSEAQNRDNRCCWWSKDDPDCQRIPLFRLATPHGHQDFCSEHIDYMLAALPHEWVTGFAYREPLTMGVGDDIPF